MIVESLLQDIIEGVSDTYGDAFFSAITLQLDKVIKSDYTFIARFNRLKHTSKTLALVASGKLIDNFEYDLKGTPCDDISGDTVCIFPCDIQKAYPEDQLLVDMKIQGYIGTPLYDSTGDVMGLIVALYTKPIEDEQRTLTLFKVFSGRIGGEIERLDKHNELVEVNINLDKKVKQRTEQLEYVIEDLKHTQKKLVEQEKMAALGDLIAGFSHEVNTPLGTVITAHSTLFEAFSLLQNKFEHNKISKSYLEQFLSLQTTCLPLIECNLRRAVELIDNFKMLAQDQSEIKPVKISLNNYYKRILLTLDSLLKRKNVDVRFSGCEDDDLITYPGCHAQLLTNLISNSIEHGFEGKKGNVIKVSISKLHDRSFSVSYQDNGIGLKKVDTKKILEPFFTTARNIGHVGLGLSISYNLAVNSLNGKFECLSTEQGAHFEYSFKAIS